SDQAEQQRQPVMGDEVQPITFEHVSNLRCPQREQPTLPAAGATYAARSGIPAVGVADPDRLFCDMSIRRSPGGAEVHGRLGKPRAALAWRMFQLITLAALIWAGWRLLGHLPYRIDIDVYRMGGRAWLDGDPLYADGAIFETRAGLNLPFTYPPLAAVAFAPFAWLSLEAAAVAITLTTLVLLVGADPVELRVRADQRRADDAGDRRLRATPHTVAARGAAGGGDRAQTHPGGVSAVLPAAPRRPRPDRRVGHRGARHPGRFRAGLAGFVGVLDPHGQQHRPHRHRHAEHQSEHRRRPGPAGARRGHPVPVVGAGLLRGAGADGLGGPAGAAVPGLRG